VVVAVLVVDQVSKAVVRGEIAPGERVRLLSFLHIVHVRNEGIAFGIGGGSAQIIVVVAVAAALIGIVAYFALHADRRLAWLPTGLLLGGALGNVIDRVRAGAVTDFIQFPLWPAFNAADISITIGVVALFLVLDAGRGR
jgi:signal peptidase II